MWNKKEMNQLDATLTRVPLTLTLNLELSRSNYFSAMEARLSWNDRDESQWDALMWNTKEMSQLDTVLTGCLWPWPLTLNFEGQIVLREWEARLTWNERDGSRWYAKETKHLGDESTRYCADWGTFEALTLTFDLELEGQIVSREWEPRLSWNERDRSWQDALMLNATTMWPLGRGYC